MTRLTLCAVILSAALTSTRAYAQAPAAPTPAQAEQTFYSVSYIEVNSSFRSTAVTTLKQYRDAGRKESGNVRLELFEQLERPGHFVVIETWKTQAAFDVRAAARERLAIAIQPGRVSDWDTRPYTTLSVASGSNRAEGAIVVITHVDVSPDPRVAPLLKALAEASRLEVGNIRFDVLLHAVRANHFEVIETWQSQKALDAHAAATVTRKYRDDLQPFLGSPLDERLFKTIE